MTRWLIPLLLGLSAICFILFHIVLPCAHGVENGLQPNTVDAYYFLRYADIWPDYPQRDYFFKYPEGVGENHRTIFPTLIAVTAKILNTDITTASAILPPILFMLTLLAVYVIAYILFNSHLVASISIFILSVMPGEILHRTMLGASDRHCFEIFLLTTAMMFILLAIRNFKKVIYFALFNLLALAFATFYLASWQGAPLIILISIIFVLVMLYNKWQMWLTASCLGIGLYLIVPNAAMTIPNLIKGTINLLASHSPSSVATEVMPLFFSSGQFDIGIVIAYFSITFFLALFGIGVLIQQYVKSKDKTLLMFLCWTLAVLSMTFLMRRFVYYSAINIAILAAFTSVYIIKLFKANKLNMYRIIAMLIITIPLVLGYRSTITALSSFGKMPIEWQECCSWLRAEVQDDNGYYFTGEDPGGGIFSQWSYGYWIVREGHIPATYTPGGWGGDDILCKADISQDIVDNKWKFIILDEEMFAANAQAIFYSNGTRPEDTAVYKLFYSGIPIWQSSNGKVKVYKTEGY